MKKVDLRTACAVAGTLVFWASSFPALRLAVRSYSAGHLALGRFAVASLIFVILHFALRRPLPQRRDWPQILLLGFFGFTVYHLALNVGQRNVSAGAGSFLISTAPLWTILLAAIFLGERISPRGWAGVAVSLCGVGLIALGESDGRGLNLSALLIGGAAMAGSVYFVLQKHLLQKYQALDLVAWAMWAGTATFLVFTPGMASAVRAAPLSATISVIYLGIFPAALAYLLWTYASTRMDVSRLVPFMYLIPPMSLLMSFVWLKEVPHSLSMIGGVVALCGVVLTNARGQKKIALK